MPGRLYSGGAALAATAVAALLLTGDRARAARADFVGSARCGGCHERAYAVWEASAHARAYDSLADESRSAGCRACHATGDAPAGPAYFRGVGCESCHGPGAGYAPADVMRDPALARALGLRDLDTAGAREALCRSCHRAGTRLSAFDAASAWERIRH